MSALSKEDAFSAPINATTFYEKINREWHKPALQLFSLCSSCSRIGPNTWRKPSRFMFSTGPLLKPEAF
jgi:hypothetical protein